MYTISLPILGFENYKTVNINILDELFSTLIFDDENIQITLVNINYFKSSNFNFNIEDEVLEKLKVSKREDFEIYFCLVRQEPIENSIVNLIAPILINQKDKIVGQYVIKDKVSRLLTTLNPNI